MRIVNSAIVRAQIQKESYGFGTFTAPKIAEVQSKTDVGEWSWVSGDNNPADLTTKPAKPIDLGQESIWDTVKGRTKGEAYGVIFNCLSTRAVHLDLIEGYSAKDFLDGLRGFVSLRGCPKEIYSDRGTQLTAAEKELRNATEIFKIKWIFNASADAPWQNGVSESLIKSVKRSLTIAIGDNILTFSKLQTTLYEIANLLNERPIGIKPGCDPELGRYLCPNDLLLGRTQNAVLKGEFERFPSQDSRLKFHEGITDTFWRKWMRDFFPHDADTSKMACRKA
ncbi:uncharacterized protein [Palaemon carinicauda]|uniref:uncharacterized protein n=1 Tax=Palaemon carinicauda TaxID=392227 RepID=UPI0035B67CCD